MHIFERVVLQWQSEKVELVPAATEAVVRETLGRTGKRYSQDVVDLFKVAGGMDGGMDPHYFSLWPLKRLEFENVAVETNNPDISFADLLLDSCTYYFRFEDTHRSSVHGGYEKRQLANSVEEFFELFLNDPQRLDLDP